MHDRRLFCTRILGSLAMTGSLYTLAGCATAAASDANDTLARELTAIEARSGGQLGVQVLDTGSGRSFGQRTDERFAMCSTFKFLAAGLVLARVDQGNESLARRLRYQRSELVNYSPVTERHVPGGMTMAEVCEAALTQSDNTAGNLMLASFGGPEALTRWLRGHGDPSTRLDRNETALNDATPGDPRDTTTPRQMAGHLQRLLLGQVLKPDSRAQLLAWMDANQTGGKRLRAGVPADWRVGDKTGSGDNGATGDIGLLRPPGRAPIVVAAYVRDTPASMDERHATFASVGRVVAAYAKSMG